MRSASDVRLVTLGSSTFSSSAAEKLASPLGHALSPFGSPFVQTYKGNCHAVIQVLKKSGFLNFRCPNFESQLAPAS